MTTQELNIRKVVWDAISHFYLDTELNHQDYDYITKKLCESEIELEELKAIDLYEVFPILQMNLLSVAGEWSGFEPSWLYEQCMKNHKKRVHSALFRTHIRMKNKLYFWMRKDHWQEIEKRIQSGLLK